MTWPEAFYKIIIDGGGGLLTAIVILALFTNFFNDMFNRGKETEEVEVIPDSVVSDVEAVIDEMRSAAALRDVMPVMLIEWAKTLDEAIHGDD